MKTTQNEQINLVEGGKENWEKTNEFKNKVSEIEKEVTDKYSLTLLKEGNWVKRLILRLDLMLKLGKGLKR